MNFPSILGETNCWWNIRETTWWLQHVGDNEQGRGADTLCHCCFPRVWAYELLDRRDETLTEGTGSWTQSKLCVICHSI